MPRKSGRLGGLAGSVVEYVIITTSSLQVNYRLEVIGLVVTRVAISLLLVLSKIII
jgi:hypothetical protein